MYLYTYMYTCVYIHVHIYGIYICMILVLSSSIYIHLYNAPTYLYAKPGFVPADSPIYGDRYLPIDFLPTHLYLYDVMRANILRKTHNIHVYTTMHAYIHTEHARGHMVHTYIHSFLPLQYTNRT